MCIGKCIFTDQVIFMVHIPFKLIMERVMTVSTGVLQDIKTARASVWRMVVFHLRIRGRQRGSIIALGILYTIKSKRQNNGSQFMLSQDFGEIFSSLNYV